MIVAIRKGARAVGYTAVAINPIYSAFIAISINNAAQGFTAKYFQWDLPGYISWPAAIIMGTGNLISDILGVNPADDIDDLFPDNASTQSMSLQQYLKDSLTPEGVISFLIKYPASLLSYFMGSGSNIVSIDWLITLMNKQLLPSIDAKLALGFGIPATAIGIVYYLMFYNGRVDKHVQCLSETLRSFKPFLRDLVTPNKSARYLELLIQVATSTLYRTTIYGFITLSLTPIFKENLTSSQVKSLMVATSGSTLINCLFTRVLSLRDRLINPAFNEISDNEWRHHLQHHKITIVKALALDVIISLLRAASVYILLTRLAHLNKWLAILISIPIFLLSFYARLTARVYQECVEAKKDQPSLLVTQDNVPTYAELNQIITNQSNAWWWGIGSINFIARTSRLLSFYLFVELVAKYLDLKLDLLTETACIGLLAPEVFKSDFAVYFDSNMATINAVRTKLFIDDANRPNASFISRLYRAYTRGKREFSQDERTNAYQHYVESAPLTSGSVSTYGIYGSLSQNTATQQPAFSPDNDRMKLLN